MSSPVTTHAQTNVSFAQPITTDVSPHQPVESTAHLEADPHRLEAILPQIKELADKVGGLRNLADLINQLDRNGC